MSDDTATPDDEPVTGPHGWTDRNAAEIAAVIDAVLAREAAKVSARITDVQRPQSRHSEK